MDRIHALSSEREELRVDTERERAEKASLQAALTEEYRYTILYMCVYIYIYAYTYKYVYMCIARREGLISHHLSLISPTSAWGLKLLLYGALSYYTVVTVWGLKLLLYGALSH